MSHPNEVIVRSMYDAFQRGDMAAVDRLLADDVTWHAPGNAQHAGVRRARRSLRLDGTTSRADERYPPLGGRGYPGKRSAGRRHPANASAVRW